MINRNKKKLKTTLQLVLPILYNNPDGEDIVYDKKIELPIGLSKEKCVKALRYIFNIITPQMSFEEVCESQGWKFLIQWKRGNYEYL